VTCRDVLPNPMNNMQCKQYGTNANRETKTAHKFLADFK